MTEDTTTQDNVFVRAIAQRRRISATYNRGRLSLEPHLLFFRHGEPYVLARNIGKPDPPEAGPRLGQFKLAGLSEVDLETAQFVPLEGFGGNPPRAGDAVIVSVAAG